MGKYRKIDPRIWNDHDFALLSDSAKLLFLFLLTHPHLTALGAMRANEAGLAVELKWTPKAFHAALLELMRKPFIKVDEKACYLGIPNFIKYNPPENPNVLKAWGSALDYIPECEHKLQLMQQVKAFAEGLGDSFAIALPKAFEKGVRKPLPNHEQEPEHEQEQEPNTYMSVSTDKQIASLIQTWKETTGVKPIRKLSLPRKRLLVTRLKDPDWDWEQALHKFPLQCFQGNGNWQPNIDWFLRPGTVDGILEGKYDFTPGKTETPQERRAREEKEYWDTRIREAEQEEGNE